MPDLYQIGSRFYSPTYEIHILLVLAQFLLFLLVAVLQMLLVVEAL